MKGRCGHCEKLLADHSNCERCGRCADACAEKCLGPAMGYLAEQVRIRKEKAE